jgi:hypothetical protein
MMIRKMANLKKNITFFVPSFADIIFIFLFIYLSIPAGGKLLSDCDTGYHIRAGEYILETLSIPRQDMFSFHFPPPDWIAHEWFSEVIIAIIHKAFGLTGIVIFFSFLISLVYYFLLKILRSLNYNILVSTAIVILVCASSKLHWFARPHIFSLLFMLIWYYLLDAYQHAHRNYLALQIALMLLWVNMHGGFIMGFILNGIFLFANIVHFFVRKDADRNLYKKKTIVLSLITGACLLVSFVNPFGYQILFFPIKLITESFYADHIHEFLSPNFHSSFVIPFELLLLLSLIIFSISKKPLNIIEIVLMIVFVHMALFSTRYIPLFSIIAAPILAKQIDLILETHDGKFTKAFKKKALSFSETDSSAKGYFWPSIAILLVILLAAQSSFTHRFDDKYKPIAAAEFLEQESIKGNLFNEYEFGDYIIYRNYLKYKVFIDGRADMYGVELFKEYFKVINLEASWKEILEKYKINWIFFPSNSVFSRFLITNNDWHLIYADKVANIFVKRIPDNKSLINKYNNVAPVIGEEQ